MVKPANGIVSLFPAFSKALLSWIIQTVLQIVHPDTVFF